MRIGAAILAAHLVIGAPAAELVRAAEEDEAALAFARALERYDAAARMDPSGRDGARAAARAHDLRARGEGDFAPLARLEGVRRDPARARDGAAIDALVRDADHFPEGRVRVEAWVLAAEAYAARLGRPSDAEPLLRRVLVDPHADDVTTAKAARDLVDVALERGDVDGARHALALAGRRATPELVSRVRRARRRVVLRTVSVATLVGVVLLVLRAFFAAQRGGGTERVGAAILRTARVAVPYALYVGGAGAILATAYDGANATPFVALGVALVPLLLVARAWGAAGSGRAPARAGRAAACACAALAIAFLVLLATDPDYLGGLGL